MSIEVSRLEEEDLTIHVVTGLVDEREMYEALEEFCCERPTMFLLWDMSQAEVSEVRPGALESFGRRSAELGAQRKGGRTAIFAPDDLNYGFGRMSEAFAKLNSAPFQLHVFRSRENALKWLKSGYTD